MEKKTINNSSSNAVETSADNFTEILMNLQRCYGNIYPLWLNIDSLIHSNVQEEKQGW